MKRPAPFRVLWAHHKPTMLLSALALVIALVFAVRLALHVLHWNNAAATLPEPWMTPRYVAHSWRIPPQEIRTALGIPDELVRRQTLKDIARQQGRSVEEVIADLSAFLLARKDAGQ